MLYKTFTCESDTHQIVKGPLLEADGPFHGFLKWYFLKIQIPGAHPRGHWFSKSREGPRHLFSLTGSVEESDAHPSLRTSDIHVLVQAFILSTSVCWLTMNFLDICAHLLGPDLEVLHRPC